MALSDTSRSFPILEALSGQLQASGHLRDIAVGWHCHLTDLTAITVDVLMKAGAQLHLSECNPDTTDAGAVEAMRKMGAAVHLGHQAPQAVLAARPQLFSDTGLVLISAYLEKKEYPVFAAAEITTSGVSKLRRLNALPLPVININAGQLKQFIENFHGVGDGLVDALARLTPVSWAGRRVAVVGYGQVGAGVCHYLRRLGAQVSVVETDPIRKLAAHYDGCALAGLDAAVASSALVVTATGQPEVLSRRQWEIAADGLHVFNVGHWAEEIDRNALQQMAVSVRNVNPHLEEFVLPSLNSPEQRRIYLATGGSPVNVALLSGSIEPTLVHLTTESLCLEFMAKRLRACEPLPPGEMTVPVEVERAASVLALKALNLQN